MSFAEIFWFVVMMCIVVIAFILCFRPAQNAKSWIYDITDREMARQIWLDMEKSEKKLKQYWERAGYICPHLKGFISYAGNPYRDKSVLHVLMADRGLLSGDTIDSGFGLAPRNMNDLERISYVKYMLWIQRELADRKGVVYDLSFNPNWAWYNERGEEKIIKLSRTMSVDAFIIMGYPFCNGRGCFFPKGIASSEERTNWIKEFRKSGCASLPDWREEKGSSSEGKQR